MSTWIIVSWVLVAILTGINIFIFMKLKGASEQMLKMAFPNAKNMTDALSQMQGMMGAMGGAGARGGFGGMGARGGFGGKPQPKPVNGFRSLPTSGGKGKAGKAAGGSDAQLKAAMEMLQNMQKGKGPRS